MTKLEEIRAKREAKEKAEVSHLNDVEKIMFQNQPPPLKYYGDERDDPDYVVPENTISKNDAKEYNSPDNGLIKGKVYAKDEIDPAFKVPVVKDPIAEKLNQDFEKEIAKVVKVGPGVVKEGKSFKAEVDAILDKYLEPEQMYSAKLYCEAVQYEKRFVQPILDERMTFFRELETLGFVKIALMIKGIRR
jgi:hypothetical protein